MSGVCDSRSTSGFERALTSKFRFVFALGPMVRWYDAEHFHLLGFTHGHQR